MDQSITLLLALRETAAGGWEYALVEPHVAPVSGALDPAEAAATLAAVRAAWPPSPRAVPVPGDPRWAEAEKQVGHALARLFEHNPRARDRLNRVRGRATGAGRPMLLAVSAEGATVQTLPWELLAASAEEPPLEVTGDARLVRMVDGSGRPRATASAPLRTAAWCPTPDDPACAGVLADLRHTLDAHAFPPPADATSAAPPEAGFLVLHLVCHGRQVEDQVTLQLADAALHPISAGARLQGWLRAASLVVLDVCHAGAATADPSDSLARMVVRLGAPACLAPLHPCDVRAAAALHRGLYAAFHDGDDILRAVGRAREAVRGRGRATVDARWHNHVLFVDHAEAADRAPERPTLALDDLPRPGPGARELLDRAAEIARGAALGYLGVEHLALALIQGPPLRGIAEHVRMVLTPHHEALRKLRHRYYQVRAPDPRPRPTPRLRRLLAGLPPGFGIDALVEALARDPGHLLHAIAATDLLELLAPPRPDAHAGTNATLGPANRSLPHFVPGTDTPGGGLLPASTVPADALEVVGGPEDGLRITPEAGQVIGRWAPVDGPACGLYRSTTVTDQTLSRTQLRWIGPGRVEIQRPGVRRGGRPPWRLVPVGPLDIYVGDALFLTPGTAVRGVIGGGDPAMEPRPFPFQIETWRLS